MSWRRLRAAMINTVLAGAGLFAALLIVEGAFLTFIEKPQLFFSPNETAPYRYDAKVGWIPVVGAFDGGHALFFEKPLSGNRKQRIVFLGDSVVAYGHITDAFARVEPLTVELLNGGVPGYSIPQEVAFYQRHLVRSNPDIIVLMFHPNDLFPGIVAVLDRDNRTVVANIYGDYLPIWPALFWRSVTYQFFAQSALRVSALRHSIEEQTTQSLADLRNDILSEGKQLLVVQLPWFKKRAEWSKDEIDQHAHNAKLLQNEHLCVLDTFPTLEKIEASGSPIQYLPGDIQHPSREYASILAAYIYQNGFQRAPLKINAGLSPDCR